MTNTKAAKIGSKALAAGMTVSSPYATSPFTIDSVARCVGHVHNCARYEVVSTTGERHCFAASAKFEVA
jgi:hypothetical protein